MDDVILAGGQVFNGLLAGTYLAFAIAVMPALRNQPDDVFVRVMNRISVVIVNPVFLAIFLGAPIITAAFVWSNRTPLAYGALAAALLALLVTVIANVPLNEALAATGNRDAFERPWLIWHAIRTASATAAFVLLCLGSAATFP